MNIVPKSYDYNIYQVDVSHGPPAIHPQKKQPQKLVKRRAKRAPWIAILPANPSPIFSLNIFALDMSSLTVPDLNTAFRVSPR